MHHNSSANQFLNGINDFIGVCCDAAGGAGRSDRPPRLKHESATTAGPPHSVSYSFAQDISTMYSNVRKSLSLCEKLKT
ncbi:hypothetical protein GE061_006138 [Apolygus lucorum]|uniref:Uncharacterized protein n=1 Tax=Apolygus lucorum TaxID=248454 RepID=A0A8S9WSD3_APOLU|nr:hypothetical protein GE061_006138 [Apolygus lucorum]